MKSESILETKLKELMSVIAQSAKNGHIVNPENVYQPFMREVAREQKTAK